MFLKMADGENAVDHLDGSPGNNRYDNLRWVTTRQKSKADPVIVFLPSGEPNSQISPVGLVRDT